MLAAGPASSSTLHRAQPRAAGGCRALSRIAAPRPCRGNPLHSPAAPGSTLLTLPSILHSGFRSLSAPNNAALAKHLPQADRAPAGGLAGATRSRSTFPAIVRRGSAALGDKRQQRSSPEESQRSRSQYALKTTTSQPRAREGGEQGGTLGTTALKRPTIMNPSEMFPEGKSRQHLDGCCSLATEATGCKHHWCLVLPLEGIHTGIAHQCLPPETFVKLPKRHSLTEVPPKRRQGDGSSPDPHADGGPSPCPAPVAAAARRQVGPSAGQLEEARGAPGGHMAGG